MTLFRTKPFAELTPFELLRILQLRSAVFLVEQTCIYQDIDDNDPRGVHIFTDPTREGLLEGCVRVFPPGVTFPQAAFGRIATSKAARGKGIGRELVRAALAWIDERTLGPVQIGAQAYLERFYREFGFVPFGEPYVEDGIPHLHMMRSAKG